MENLILRFADYIFDERRSDKACLWLIAVIAVILIGRTLVTLFFGV